MCYIILGGKEGEDIMKKEETRKSILNFYGPCFAVGTALGLTEAEVAKKLYDDYEISYFEMLAFQEEEEKEND